MGSSWLRCNRGLHGLLVYMPRRWVLPAGGCLRLWHLKLGPSLLLPPLLLGILAPMYKWLSTPRWHPHAIRETQMLVLLKGLLKRLWLEPLNHLVLYPHTLLGLAPLHRQKSLGLRLPPRHWIPLPNLRQGQPCHLITTELNHIIPPNGLPLASALSYVHSL